MSEPKDESSGSIDEQPYQQQYSFDSDAEEDGSPPLVLLSKNSALERSEASIRFDSRGSAIDFSATRQPATRQRGRDTTIKPTLSADSDDDDELRLAKEMAMAIAKNPNLTPSELRKLQDKSTNMSQRQKKRSKSPFDKVSAASDKAKDKAKSAAKSILRTLSKEGSSGASIAGSISGTSLSLKSPTTQEPPANRPKVSVPVKRQESSSSVGLEEDLEKSVPMYTTGEITKSDDGSESVPTISGLVSSEKKEQIRMTGIVWKRRSGLGKYSSTQAWERRRIVLKGNILSYYKKLSPSKDDDEFDEETSVGSVGSGDLPTNTGEPTVAPSTMNTQNTGAGWLESSLKQATDLANSLATGTTFSAPQSDTSARGYLDLVKENASVNASLGHSGAPTPFALSVKILTQTKWKFCFDSQKELMQWLAALTDAIVTASVDAYNSTILQATDPTKLEPTFIYGQLSEPPTEQQGGHGLWFTSPYCIKSEAYDDDDDDENDSLEKLSDAESQVDSKKTSNPFALMLDPTSGTSVFHISEDYILLFAGMINFAILLTRASSTSVETFWHILVFTNTSMFLFLQKDRVGMQVKKPVITSRMAKRLSSVMGLKVYPTVQEEDTEKKKIATSSIEKKPPKEVYRPPAGSTTIELQSADISPITEDENIYSRWIKGDPLGFSIRSHGYKQTKVKVPSPGELYSCVKVDIFNGAKRSPDMAGRVTLPKVEWDNDPAIKTWNAPDIFVISVSLPTDPPRLYATVDDGGGFTITMYYRMHKDTREILKEVTADGYIHKDDSINDMQTSKVNAVRLFEEWCRRAPTDDSWMARFKVIPQGHNFTEIGLPAWISKYNSKPFLIKRPGQTGFLYNHKEQSCMEFDVSLFPFPYLAKQGICLLKDSYVKKMLVSFGFAIEGRSDDELPECLLGVVKLCYPDPRIHASDWFAGKGPKSCD
jgi:hypothetical protein